MNESKKKWVVIKTNLTQRKGTEIEFNLIVGVSNINSNPGLILKKRKKSKKPSSYWKRKNCKKEK